MFIQITNGNPKQYTIGQLRRDNPAVSFPNDSPEDTLAEFGVYKAVETSAPNIDSKTHRHVHHFEEIDGVWTQVWEIVPLPEEQQLENLKAARESAYRKEADPLFFKYQRGEIEQQEWLDKVAEIKDRYNY
jgi:hypothetical protein